jgi:hypothetical protein
MTYCTNKIRIYLKTLKSVILLTYIKFYQYKNNKNYYNKIMVYFILIIILVLSLSLFWKMSSSKPKPNDN